MKIRRQFDSDYKGSPGVVITGDSKTNPDMALTVRQILGRMANGVKTDDLYRTGSYTEDKEIPVFDDISDYDRWREFKSNEIRENEKLLKKAELLTNKLQKDVQDNSRNHRSGDSGNPSNSPRKGKGEGNKED